MGGGAYGAVLAMLAVALAPFDFAVGNLLTMNAFEPLFWTLAAILVLEEPAEPRAWRRLALGLVLGIGFLNKWSIAAFAFALVAGLVLGGRARLLRSAGFWGACALAALCAAPNLWWQAAHGWPQLVLLRNAAAVKDAVPPPLAFVAQQALVMGPGALPVWIAGLWSAARDPRLRPLAWAYLVLLLLYVALRAKIYYMAPIYPALIAAGAAAIGRAFAARPRARIAFAGFVALASLAILPAATPILPLRDYLAYQRVLDLRPVRMERRQEGLVPQHFADQLGWKRLVATVTGAVDGLSPQERAHAAILTADYGQASALAFLGRGLPPAISGHNQYYLWGPDGEHPVLVAIGIPRATLLRAYRRVDRVATYEDPYVLPYSNDLPVYVCRDPRLALTALWPSLRRYL